MARFEETSRGRAKAHIVRGAQLIRDLLSAWIAELSSHKI